MAVSFFRAVSLAELSDFRSCGRLRVAAGSCEGKHLARSLEDARRWGAWFYAGSPFRVLRITVTEEAAARFVGWERLDGIGPACFATMDELQGAQVSEVTDEP